MCRIGRAIWPGDSMPGGHLVEQRLEQVVVAAVDQRDVDRLAAEEAGREEPAEAAADDDDRGAPIGQSPGLECMMPPSAKIVVAVR